MTGQGSQASGPSAPSVRRRGPTRRATLLGIGAVALSGVALPGLAAGPANALPVVAGRGAAFLTDEFGMALTDEAGEPFDDLEG